jgi:hypothetical protein
MNRRNLAAAITLVAVLTVGCETTSNTVSSNGAISNKASGVVLFTLTHDKDLEHLGRRAHNVQLIVTMKNLETGSALTRSLSYDVMALFPTTPFVDVWGKVFARELPPGRYAFDSWLVEQNTGVGWRTYSPKTPVKPLIFEVKSGSNIYIGNIHGKLLWGKNIFGLDLLAGAIPIVENKAERDLPLILKDNPQLKDNIVVEALRSGPWIPE